MQHVLASRAQLSGRTVEEERSKRAMSIQSLQMLPIDNDMQMAS